MHIPLPFSTSVAVGYSLLFSILYAPLQIIGHAVMQLAKVAAVRYSTVIYSC
jgi:hypothetical protein